MNGYSAVQPWPQHHQKERNKNAWLSLLFGIGGLFVCCFAVATAPVTFYFAWQAQKDFAAFPGRYSNESHATIGFVLSGVQLVAFLLAIALSAMGHVVNAKQSLKTATSVTSAAPHVSASIAPALPSIQFTLQADEMPLVPIGEKAVVRVKVINDGALPAKARVYVSGDIDEMNIVRIIPGTNQEQELFGFSIGTSFEVEPNGHFFFNLVCYPKSRDKHTLRIHVGSGDNERYTASSNRVVIVTPVI